MSTVDGRDDSESIYKAPTSTSGLAPLEDLESHYVGPKNADYYAAKFAAFSRGAGKIGWNWPAFFISSIWLLYRKMWLNAALYWLALPLVLAILSYIIGALVDEETGTSFYYLCYLVVAFLLVPMFANYLYYRHAQAKVRKVAAVTSSPEQQAAELERIGGTSSVVLIIVPIFLVSLIGILAAIAIPAYQDYTIRAQVAEALNLAAGSKIAVAEYYADEGRFPADNAEAGLPPAEQISGAYVASVAIDQGHIIAIYGEQAHDLISGKGVVLVPAPGNEAEAVLEWTCYSDSLEPKHLPASCR
jgi:hypothetical protein